MICPTYGLSQASINRKSAHVVHGGVEEPPPEKACSVPGKGADPRGGRGFQHFRRRPAFFFRVPCLKLQFYGSRFFAGMKHYHPPGILSRIPGYFGSAVERLLTLQPQQLGLHRVANTVSGKHHLLMSCFWHSQSGVNSPRSRQPSSETPHT